MEKKHTRELQITSQRELINLTGFTRLALLLPTYCTVKLMEGIQKPLPAKREYQQGLKKNKY